VVDDYEIVREAVSALLNADDHFSVVAVAKDAEEALSQLEASEVDVVIMDLSMPGVTGTDAIILMTRRFPKVKVVVLSMYDDAKAIANALRAGAAAYILKEDVTEKLTSTIGRVMLGDRIC
jgi:DNA-binding NarL/FixJ family response regulator